MLTVVKRRFQCPRVSDIWVRTALQQRLHSLDVAAVSCCMQRRYEKVLRTHIRPTQRDEDA